MAFDQKGGKSAGQGVVASANEALVPSGRLGAEFMALRIGDERGGVVSVGAAPDAYPVSWVGDGVGVLPGAGFIGIALGTDPETILAGIDDGTFMESQIEFPENRWASDREDQSHVKDVDSPTPRAPTPARFNADPRRHYEASGSAGKVSVFAVRLDTFAADEDVAVFYIGSNDPAELETIRRKMRRVNGLWIEAAET